MKRVLGILVGASLALAIGCAQSYDLRLEETLKTMKYRKDLDKNTEGPPKGSSLENAKVYIRSPKGLALAKTFTMAPIEQGKFDGAVSFIDPEKQASLHILARNNGPKPTTKKGPGPGGPAEQPPAAVRGDFNTDVLDLIKGAYSTDVDPAQLKATETNSHGRRGKTYKSTTLEASGKEVKVYFYGEKSGPAQVALIFEGPKEAIRGLITQIEYSLNSLATGPTATSFYNGGDELAAEEGAAASGLAF